MDDVLHAIAMGEQCTTPAADKCIYSAIHVDTPPPHESVAQTVSSAIFAQLTLC